MYCVFLSSLVTDEMPCIVKDDVLSQLTAGGDMKLNQIGGMNPTWAILNLFLQLIMSLFFKVNQSTYYLLNIMSTMTMQLQPRQAHDKYKWYLKYSTLAHAAEM